MAQYIRTSLTSTIFCVIIVMCVNCSIVKSNKVKFNFPDFESVKGDLFFVNYSKVLSPNDMECSIEMNAIRIGLATNELWAHQSEWIVFKYVLCSMLLCFRFVICTVLDAWGKMPAGVLSGNYYDFGEFSQCFNIQKNEQLYKTQYCLGKLIFDSPKPLKPKYFVPL